MKSYTDFITNMNRILLVLLFLLLTLVFFCCSNDYKTDLGGGYYLDTYNGMNQSFICEQSGAGVITMAIIDYAYDSVFIVVAQRPWDSVPEVKSVQYGQTRIFNKSSFVQYWIINKREERIFHYDPIAQRGYRENVYGPFKRKEYLEKRVELGVADSLKLPKYDF